MYTDALSGMSSIQSDQGPIAGGRKSSDHFLQSRVRPLHVAAMVLAIAALISVLAACYVITRSEDFYYLVHREVSPRLRWPIALLKENDIKRVFYDAKHEHRTGVSRTESLIYCQLCFSTSLSYPIVDYKQRNF